MLFGIVTVNVDACEYVTVVDLVVPVPTSVWLTAQEVSSAIAVIGMIRTAAMGIAAINFE
jgi:hypothetical protein